MKLWFFVEGDSEVHFVANLMRKEFPAVLQQRDISEFVHTDKHNSNCYYCDNCRSIDRVPYQINEYAHLISKSHANAITIVGDIERLRCAQARREKIHKALEGNVQQNTLRFVFSLPKVEEIYWDYPEIIVKILTKTFKDKFSRRKVPSFRVPSKPTADFEGKLKEVFKKYELKYRPVDFAEMFFPRLSYQTSRNATVVRLYTVVNHIVST
jgi:hypothetical protein